MEREQIKDILTPEFMAELMELETAEDVQKALDQKGLSLTVTEINNLRKILESQAAGEGELSEDALEEVAGGGLFETLSDYFVKGFDAVDRWTRSRW